MKKTICKKLRDIAETKTIGKDKMTTRRLYRKLKKEWKLNTRILVHPKFNISKRQKRLLQNTES